jgi:Na+/H+-dicarboxylate symporter
MPKLAMHWWILMALLAGAALGLTLNQVWTPASWKALGVTDPASFLAGKTAPDASGSTEATEPGMLAHAARFAIDLAKFVGDLFLRLLRMLAVPVVLFSLIAAVAGVGEPRELGTLGGRTLLVFALTAVIAVIIALAITNITTPGAHVSDETRVKLQSERMADATARAGTYAEFAQNNTIWSQLLNAFPANPFKAMAEGEMLQVVTFSTFLGAGLLLVPTARRAPALGVVEALADACLRGVGLIMKLAPIAVFCITATLLARLGLSVLAALSVFVASTLVGLAIILFVQYPALIRLLTHGPRRMTYARFFKGMAPAQLLAFSSSSSAATMPVTMECCDRLGVPRRVSGLVVPLGTTINMDGTALYQVMCVTFLAQLYDIPLTLIDQISIAFMAILVAIGSPGLPGASLVLMVFILSAFKIPIEGLAIIIAVDRLLDMARTVINVSGDAAAAVIVAGTDLCDPTQQPK